MKKLDLPVNIEKDEETSLFIGTTPSLPGAHTQAESLEELQGNLHEVQEFCLEEIIGYKMDGTPISAKEFLEQSEEAVKQMKAGKEGISIEELRKRSMKWLTDMQESSDRKPK